MKNITGVLIQYYFACKRELWFFANYINMNYEDKNISIGKYIHKIYYKKKKKEILIDNTINIDFKKNGKTLTIFEIKKSSKLKEPAIWQLKYYLYYLKKKGMNAIGVILYPSERKKEKVILNKKDIFILENTIKEIKNIIKSPVPPLPERKPYCKNCSYYEFCWS